MPNYQTLPQLGFIEAVKLASKRLLEFKGRSRRSEFWWWMLLVIIANEIIPSLMPSLLANAIAATIIMFFGLSVTARRLQDTGHSALWVYVSYAIGIVFQIYSATSVFLQKLMEMASSGSINERAIEKLAQKNMGEIFTVTGISLAFCLLSLIVIIFCMIDSKPGINKYGESPKYPLSAE